MRGGYLIFSVLLLLSSGGYSIYDFMQPPRTVLQGNGGAELSLLAYGVALGAVINLPLALFLFFRRKE